MREGEREKEEDERGRETVHKSNCRQHAKYERVTTGLDISVQSLKRRTVTTESQGSNTSTRPSGVEAGSR